MLGLQLERLQLIDGQIAKLNRMIAQAMKPHQEAVMRLAEVPGLGEESAQQIAEVGVHASTFASAAELTSWVGTCPGKEESAEENHSSRSAKRQQISAASAKPGGARCGEEEWQFIFRRCSGVRCLGWAISPPSGLSLIGSAAWFGRYGTRGCDLSSKAANRIPGPRRNALRCWRERFASSATKSQSHP
jgi:hypothetical protein